MSRTARQPATQHSDEDLCRLGRAVIETEAAAVAALGERIGADFARACRLLLDCRGRVVVIGMGKSGHIGGKLAATLASTGTPAFFVHPGEASHGDLGMITAEDVVIGLSNSGETDEINLLLPLIKRLAVPLVALSGNPGSTLARAATVHLDVGVAEEACPLGLAPTSSTTATLAMGDALAIALLDARGFTRDDFALSHPGGRLGRRLLLRIDDLMHTGERLPRVGPDTLLGEALVEMSRKGLGMTAVVDDDDRVLGVFTDGDLRRTLDHGVDVHGTRVREVMTAGGRQIPRQSLAAEALELMERHRINALLVTDDEHRLIGALNMHDLLRAGVV
ncbi:KpsF/GutQ family sugar-phosphate isomerase [Sediminicurvatus halobius]|uniref:Arabinose 5-phosphate isomerase n=1 Tax=Sediminicurvatus halobius TaxID=2182432 RepID=A0A2U2N7Y9_9GAMM|nr:KpsF/GutQ family sugar-phosphate isomerase [Spiribacter halobius]PWG65202.1 D-arabinose 5-phosphate isomerase [Spiribacter halobius]UEX78844.1 KpsF/GutQ family sugar-phosphate isomerase [Spiribacter halobius]